MKTQPEYIITKRRVQRLIIAASVVLLSLGIAQIGLKAALNVDATLQQASEGQWTN